MATTYLSRTASAGNRKTWTFSAWVKRSALNSSGYQTLFSSDQTVTNSVRIKFDSSPNDTKFEIYYYTGTMQLQLATNRLFRDTSAWYHIVVAVDTTQATASDRAKIYVNGVQETSLAIETYPSQNTDTSVNQSGAPHEVGNGGGNLYFNGSMSHVHLIDGTAYDATAFGEYDANGVWTIIVEPSVTYGTNGFFILKNGNSVTDQSGEGNNLTVAGGTLTNTEDNPSNVFATINSLDNFYFGGTFSNGNLTAVSNVSGYTFCTSTMGVSSGKWYVEAKLISSSYLLFGATGNVSTGTTQGIGNAAGQVSYSGQDGALRLDGVYTGTWGSTYTAGDIVGVALDLDNNKVYFSKNGVWQVSGDPSAGTGGVTISASSTTLTGNYFFGSSDNDSGASSTFSYNFGNGYFGTTAVASAGTNASGIGIFEYDVPTGFTALSTKGLNL
mgnify:CR=1 FL=1